MEPLTLRVLVDIATVVLYRYGLPLHSPLEMDNSTLERRRGLLVRLGTKRGTVGWGDAAPLPGFSREMRSDVAAHARTAAPEWVGTRIPESHDALDRSLRALSTAPECPRSLQFATESAVVDLLAATHGRTVPAVLGTPRSTVALNALITRPEVDGTAKARRCRAQGYRAVKVKVGRASVETEVQWLRMIRQGLGDSVALRVDANRAWSRAEAEAFSDATGDLGIDYVEEPLSDPTQIEDLVRETDLPVALDETTREVDPDVLRDGLPVSAVVLKPTLLGGLRRTMQWRRRARENDVTPVVSAAYESGVGLRMLVALAATGPDTPVGLSTYDRLAADVLRPRLPLNSPTVEVASAVDAAVSVDGDSLDRIAHYSP